jgi:predicted Asp-tRNA(Asn)/Glu-tRNA(Gln) amidotransferase subunit C|tara:strand:+ start:675 stop:917 length:243 start_codon:yes stop_codon:yes gene_type:complete
MVLNEEEIRKEAKQILDKFASALEKVEKESSEESYVDREEFERVESKGEKCDSNFKKKILENASESDDDFIITEKGDWKK